MRTSWGHRRGPFADDDPPPESEEAGSSPFAEEREEDPAPAFAGEEPAPILGEDDPGLENLEDEQTPEGEDPEAPAAPRPDGRRPLFVLRSTFCWPAVLLWQALGWLVWVLILPPFIWLFIKGPEFSSLPYFKIALIVLAVVAPISALIIFNLWRSYRATVYYFFPKHCEAREEYLVREYEQLAYRHVVDVALNQGPFQRLFGLGNIVLESAAGDSLAALDVPRAREAYAAILKLVRQGQGR